MWKNPKIMGFVVALVMAIVTMVYYFYSIHKSNEFIIDNPKDMNVNVTIDDSNYVLGPYQSISITLKEGKHSIISTTEDSIIAKDTFSIQQQIRGLINPTLSKYVIYKLYYGKNINRDSLMKSHVSYLDSIPYYGELKETQKVFISDFYLNVNQSYPKVKKSQDSISAISKIYRKENFKSFYKDYLE